MGRALDERPGRGSVSGSLLSAILRLLAAFATTLVLFMVPAAAQAVRTANVETQFHSSRAAIAPGERFTIVLRQTIREGWHTYWRNPGDSGLPTRIDWRLPAGFEAGPIQWPAPEALPFDRLVNFGYSGEVLLPIELRAPPTLRPGGAVTLTADAHWLVCSDICIPEDATLSLTLPVAASGRDDPTWAPRIRDAVAALPAREAGVAARITPGAPGVLSVTIPALVDVRNPHFFPFDPNVMQNAAPQAPRLGASGMSFALTPGAAGAFGRSALEGVVTFEAASDGAWVRRSLEVSAEPGAPLAGTTDRAAPITSDYPLAELERANVQPPSASFDLATALAAIGFALLGGLILNVMPCVLPVLTIKALSFAGGAHAGAARRHGLFYLAGVMATFLLLAGLLTGLRAAGEAVGWGFQLQSPTVTSGLALLFFAIGLNLLGVFDIGGLFQNAGGALVGRAGETGAFFTGALAVVAATPCTAPFMAGAIGAALTQSTAMTFAVFSALGLGFAAPLTALSFAPGLQRLLPKPGPWMTHARQALAFPMFGAAIWLAWVLTEQTGAGGGAALLSLATALAFVLFVRRWGRIWLATGLIVLAAAAYVTWRPLTGTPVREILAPEAWSPARVAALRGEGRGVFVNFTAAWCVTCKLNEATTLSRPRVAGAFAERRVAYLVADWTNQDSEIAAALAEHGRAGVPLYLYYAPGDAPPVVLPQVLSEDAVVGAIER